jgi:Domain of unknown function (DUF6378)
MNADHLLEQASTVVGHRRGIYGAPDAVFEHVAMRWSQVLGTRVTPAQVIICLIDLKIVRVARDPKHPDSITDIAGYAGVLAEVLGDA